MRIGVTVLPDPPYQRLVDLIGMAEEQGFESGWTYDSPILWQEPYPLLTLMVQRTKSSVDSPDQARAAPAVGRTWLAPVR